MATYKLCLGSACDIKLILNFTRILPVTPLGINKPINCSNYCKEIFQIELFVTFFPSAIVHIWTLRNIGLSNNTF